MIHNEEHPAPKSPVRNAKGRRRRRRARDIPVPFVNLAPREAAEKLGFASVEALWAFLRRHQTDDGSVDLGGGAHAFRRGRRTWVIRIPVAAR